MVDNELLLAISDLLDIKLKDIRAEQTRMSIMLENEIRSDIKLLAENYVPAAKRYEKANDQIESMQADIDILKKVVTGHSERLQKIS